MKHYKSEEISHAWFHQSSPEGDSPGAMSFNGPDILSYRTVMARIVEHKGRKAVVLNSRKYSITTTKHFSRIRQAIPHGTLLFWWNGEPPRGSSDSVGKALFNHAIERAADHEAQALKARRDTVKAGHQESALHCLTEAGTIKSFFGLRRKVDKRTIERVRKAAEVAERKAAKESAERQRKHDERRAAEMEENRKYYEEWKAGQHVSRQFPSHLFPVAFRVESRNHQVDDDEFYTYELVSTLGARVPLEDAKRALKFVLLRREREWRRNGDTCPVGSYQLDSISGVGIIAGCHRITWDEIDRLAGMLLTNEEVVS